MKKQLIEKFVNEETIMSYRNIKRFLGVSRAHKDNELKDLLKTLEIEGILYKDNDGLYKSKPSNFFVKEIKSTKKGSKYIEHNDERIYLSNEKSHGALTFDKVLVEINNDSFVIKKIILRSFPNIVCEVILENGKKKLKPVNIDNNLDISIGSSSLKKLIIGERVLVNVSTDIYEDNKYIAEIIKSIGHASDPDIDYKTIAYNHGIMIDFSSEALEELNNIPDHVEESDIEGKVDLRDLKTFTIDGIDCEDMDDAISIKRTDNGYVLGVHIAHVSHYIKPGSVLFEEALNRGNSVYFPDSVIPMFPYKISKGICSLNEKVDRLARSFIIQFDNDANIVDYRIVQSVIHSKKKMNYDAVDKVINGETPDDYKEFEEDILIAKELSDKLSVIKNNRGYIGFDSSELKFELDNLGNTKTINVKKRKSSEELIENFMLVANNLAAISLMNKPCVYRNHPYPSKLRLEETLNTLEELGYKTKNMRNISEHILIQKLLKMVKDKEEFTVLSNMILRSMKLAYYDIENVGHFGLALEDYVHFTSPIRRLPDLLNSTILDLYDNAFLSLEEQEKYEILLKEGANRASKTERLSEQAEYEVDKLQVINYLKSHIGMHTEVFIESITPNYLIVRSKEFMDGIITIEDLHDDVIFLPTGKLKSKITGNYYKIGHKLEVEIKDASYKDNIIYYNYINNLTLQDVKERKLKLSKNI